MRDPCGAELLLFARVLQGFPPPLQPGVADRILHEADLAHRDLGRLGHSSPVYGDGSLMARCHLMAPGAEPLTADRPFLSALIVAAEAILRQSRA